MEASSARLHVAFEATNLMKAKHCSSKPGIDSGEALVEGAGTVSSENTEASNSETFLVSCSLASIANASNCTPEGLRGVFRAGSAKPPEADSDGVTVTGSVAALC